MCDTQVDVGPGQILGRPVLQAGQGRAQRGDRLLELPFLGLADALLEVGIARPGVDGEGKTRQEKGGATNGTRERMTHCSFLRRGNASSSRTTSRTVVSAERMRTLFWSGRKLGCCRRTVWTPGGTARGRRGVVPTGRPSSHTSAQGTMRSFSVPGRAGVGAGVGGGAGSRSGVATGTVADFAAGEDHGVGASGSGSVGVGGSE